jgi:hypothetical protein
LAAVAVSAGAGRAWALGEEHFGNDPLSDANYGDWPGAMPLINNESRVYHTEDLAPGENLVFAATGVTAGDLLQGVRFFGGGARTHSLVMAYQTKQVRFVDTVHMFDRESPPRVRL